jgi:hypothetical protein
VLLLLILPTARCTIITSHLVLSSFRSPSLLVFGLIIIQA